MILLMMESSAALARAGKLSRMHQRFWRTVTFLRTLGAIKHGSSVCAPGDFIEGNQPQNRLNLSFSSRKDATTVDGANSGVVIFGALH
jgi:hypothetical protein